MTKEIIFNRGTKPADIVGRSELIGTCDRSMDSFAGLIFIHWQTVTEEWTSNLLCAKARVILIMGITQPRSELCSAMVLARLMTTVIKTLKEKPGRITLIGDSKCVITAM